MSSYQKLLLTFLIAHQCLKITSALAETPEHSNGVIPMPTLMPVNPTLLQVSLDLPKKFLIDPNATYELQVAKIPVLARYILFQVHSYMYEVTLSTVNPITRHHGTYDRGVNVGLVTLLQVEQISSSVYLQFSAPQPINVLIRAELYTYRDPIPGGCNMEFDVEISPFLKVTYNAFVTNLKFQPGSVGYRRGEVQPLCDRSTSELSYDFYVYHVKDRDLSEESYFSALEKMSSLKSIKNEGQKVGPFFGSSHMSFDIVTYRRQGVIFSIVANAEQNRTVFSAPYVPAATYGCQLRNDSSDPCDELMTPFEWIIAIFASVVGLGLCFLGHRFFKTAMVLYGFLAASMIMYIILERFASPELHYAGVAALTFIFGLAGGLSWLAVWWFSGSPVIAVLLPGFDLGFFLGAIAMFTPLGYLEIFRANFNFWIAIACLVLIVPILLIFYSKQLHILTCALFGSYGIILLLDRFANGCLSYIVINIIRRATVPGYNDAINVTSFQSSDIILTVIWVSLTAFGTAFQLWRERKRPPFPMSPYHARRLQAESASAQPGCSSARQEDAVDYANLESQPLLRHDNSRPGYRSNQKRTGDPAFF